MTMNKIAFFASGNGTNMENLVKAIQAGKVTDAEPALLVCDKPEANVIKRAEKLGVKAAVIDRKKFETKDAFEEEIMRVLEEHQVEWIALAGYMRILGSAFVRRYLGKMINVHPSLLPDFPGAHSIRDAFEAKVKETGVTVHFVDEGVDTGAVILQKKVPVDSKDTLESLEEKIHAVEYEIYPEALQKVLSGEVKLPPHHREDEFWTKD